MTVATTCFRYIIFSLCVFVAAVLSAPLPDAIAAHNDRSLWARASTASPKPPADVPHSPVTNADSITATLAIKRANKEKANEHWMLLVDTGNKALDDTEMSALIRLNPPQSAFDPITSFQLTVQGLLMGANPVTVPLRGKVEPTLPEFRKVDETLGSVTFGTRQQYISWLQSINGKKPLAPPVKIEGNCISFIGWALDELPEGAKLSPKERMKWEKYRDELIVKVHDKVYGKYIRRAKETTRQKKARTRGQTSSSSVDVTTKT